MDILSYSSLKMDSSYNLSKLWQIIKKCIIEIMKYTQTKYTDTTRTIDIERILVEIYLELYKKYLLCAIIDDIYQFTCDKKQEKTIAYEQKIKTIYDLYLDKFKKNTKISEAESKLLSSYRDKIDWIKYNIPRARQDSLNFFYSVYALNELFGCYIDDYLELVDYLEFDEDLVELGKNFYMENKKFNVL